MLKIFQTMFKIFRNSVVKSSTETNGESPPSFEFCPPQKKFLKMRSASLCLQEVVDCPEFLVYFPALEKLADRYGLMLIGKQKFANYFKVKNKDI